MRKILMWRTRLIIHRETHLVHLPPTELSGNQRSSEQEIKHFCAALEAPFDPRVDPDRVKYEAHYDAGRDVSSVEVFKPGRSPYPLPERPDIVNHSPTESPRGYGGGGPAQCAFAILMGYLRDEERARALYQHFKFAVLSRFAPTSDWMLTGCPDRKRDRQDWRQ